MRWTPAESGEVETLILSGPHDVVAFDPFPRTPRAKKVIEYAMEEARNLNHDHVGTEHILLGLIREEEGVAAQILMNFGIKLDDVRGEVLAILGRPEARRGKAVARPAEPIPEPPAFCPKCGQPRVVRVLWGWVHLWGQKEEVVRSGKAILGSQNNREGPPWVCLQCAPAGPRFTASPCKTGSGNLPRKMRSPPKILKKQHSIEIPRTNCGGDCPAL